MRFQNAWIALVLCLPVPGLSQSFNAFSDFCETANPCGTWTYGYTAALGAPLVAFTTPVPITLGIVKWGTPGQDPSLDVGRNNTGANVLGAPPTFFWPFDMLHMHPSITAQYAVVRWRAPADGRYTFKGKFQGLDSVTTVASTDVHIRLNLFNVLFAPTQELHGYPQQHQFEITRELLAGDLVDFMVGQGSNGNHNNDSTGLQVMITQAGPPVALIVPGSLGTKLAKCTDATCTTADHTIWLTDRTITLRATLGQLKFDKNGNPIVPLTPNGPLAGLLNLTPNPGDKSNELSCGSLMLALFNKTADCLANIYTYNNLYETLAAAGHDPQTFPYDWRLGLPELSEQLYATIKELSRRHQNRRIAIIAHSMGGLIMGEALRRHQSDLIPILGPIVTLGTPFIGSVKTYILLRGWDSILPTLGNLASKELGEHWTSVYYLLPRYDFFTFRGETAPYKDLYEGQFRCGSILCVGPALPRQDALPLVYSMWDASIGTAPYVNAVAIIGSGLPTPTGISDRLPGRCVTKEVGNGDGTVPLQSALASPWIAPQNMWFITEAHVALPSNELVLDSIKRILVGLQPALLSRNATQLPQDAPTGERIPCQ